MSKPKVLIQIDPDSHASTFDSMVAIDSGIDHLLSHSNVTVKQIESLVHGAMFTRGPKDLHQTALFLGGSDVAKTELLIDVVKKCFFGPMRVSILADPNGSNTTAAAAVICAQRHGTLAGKTITILAGTGPVGQRIAQIVAGPATDEGVPPAIRVCSRSMDKAQAVCKELANRVGGDFTPMQAAAPGEALAAARGADVVFAAGAAGIELLSAAWMELSDAPSVLVDLNAVPPAGIAGIEVMDTGEPRGNSVCYGAIGVGGLKMKIHKHAIKKLFDANDLVFEVEEIYRLGVELESNG